MRTARLLALLIALALSSAVVTPAAGEPEPAPPPPATQKADTKGDEAKTTADKKIPGGQPKGAPCFVFGARWCTNPAERHRFLKAWRLARDTDNDERDPVPFPYGAVKTGAFNDRTNVLYVVKYKVKKKRYIYKYGITSLNPKAKNPTWQKRANQGKKDCMGNPLILGKQKCYIRWVASFTPEEQFGGSKHPRFDVRFGEASMIFAFTRKPGNRLRLCPIGQRLSCR